MYCASLLSLTFQPSEISASINTLLLISMKVGLRSSTKTILSPMTFKLGITLTIKCYIRGSLSTGLSRIVRWVNFSRENTPSSPTALSILLLCKYRISSLVNFSRPSLGAILVMWLLDRSSFSRLVHLCRNSSYQLMMSLPESTRILSFSGATIFLFRKMSWWGCCFFFWMSRAPVVLICLLILYQYYGGQVIIILQNTPQCHNFLTSSISSSSLQVSNYCFRRPSSLFDQYTYCFNLYTYQVSSWDLCSQDQYFCWYHYNCFWSWGYWDGAASTGYVWHSDYSVGTGKWVWVPLTVTYFFLDSLYSISSLSFQWNYWIMASFSLRASMRAALSSVSSRFSASSLSTCCSLSLSMPSTLTTSTSNFWNCLVVSSSIRLLAFSSSTLRIASKVHSLGFHRLVIITPVNVYILVLVQGAECRFVR